MNYLWGRTSAEKEKKSVSTTMPCLKLDDDLVPFIKILAYALRETMFVLTYKQKK